MYGNTIEYYLEKGCKFVECKIDRRGTSIKNDALLTLNYFRIIKTNCPDIVLTYTTKCSIYGGIACEILNIPYIVNTAGLMQSGDDLSRLEKFILFLYRLSLKKASCLMFQNAYEKDVVLKAMHHNINHRLIPGSGVNLETYQYSDYPDCDNGLVFNYVARIVSIKGIHEFLDCATRIKREYPCTHFRIYGEYDDDTYRKIIQQHEKQGIVEYFGVKSDMKSAIQDSHAVIHPSYYEGMTNVVLEHSAVGRPCLGSDIPGIREAIEEGKTGYTFKVRNVDDMYEKICKFIELPHDKKIDMGKKARIKMENEFSRDIITEIYIEEINKIIS